MELSDVHEIKKLTDTDEANELLNHGWILINTYTYVADEFLSKDLTLVYVLGRLEPRLP